MLTCRDFIQRKGIKASRFRDASNLCDVLSLIYAGLGYGVYVVVTGLYGDFVLRNEETKITGQVYRGAGRFNVSYSSF